MLPFLSILIGYLLGSLPTAYLAGRRIKKADIRTLGGGNMGALNATRELGLAAGAIVLAVDIAKGAASVLIAQALVSYPWVCAAGMAAVIGHCWPVYLKFKGGKGAATAIGVCLALAPLPFLCSAPLMLIVIGLTSNVTLGMATGFILLPLFVWLFGEPWQMLVFILILLLFLAMRYLGTARRNLTQKGWRDFIIEKNFTPWQSRRKRKYEKPGPKAKTASK